MQIRHLLALVVAALALGACGGGDEKDAEIAAPDPKAPLKVGVSPVPHGEILDFVAKELAPAEDLKLEVISYDDYIQPNVALEERKLDANYFQHQPYLDQQKKDNPSYDDFVAFKGVHLEPLGIYSKSVKDVSELPEGSTVTLSNDPANAARGLRLLARSGLIGLKLDAGLEATPNDIAKNPKKLRFKAIAPANLARTLGDADLAIINGNYAIEAGLSPATDTLLIEPASGNPYANFLVAREDNKSDPRIEKLERLLHTPEVKKFIKDKYKGSVIPAE